MPAVGKGKIRLVYRAYLSGCRITEEVAQETGMPIKVASAYTATLVRRGALLDRGPAPHQPHGYSGTNAFKWYEPVQGMGAKA